MTNQNSKKQSNKRTDGRSDDSLRKAVLETNASRHAEGSCLITMGETKVLCVATVEEKVPPFLKGTGKGWVTAEYGMLPRSCIQRIPRDGAKGKPNGRSLEIQRLIGRSLRCVTDMQVLGERQITIDCDVLEGDGGTRCASITGSYVALVQACQGLVKNGILSKSPVRDQVAAVSVGILDGRPLLDLCYAEDSRAEVDMNIVMTGAGKFVEVQGTAEREAFSDAEMKKLIDLARKGISELIAAQKKVLGAHKKAS